MLFTISFLVAVGGTIVTMGGLAAMTAFCWDHQPLGLGAGFKVTPVRPGMRLHSRANCLQAGALSPIL